MNNPQSTDRVSENTNNLIANIVTIGYITLNSTDFVNSGGLIGGSSPAYYATKSVTLSNISSAQVPYVMVWFSLGNNLYTNTYYKLSQFQDKGNPYVNDARTWYTLTKSGTVYSLNIYAMNYLGNTTSGQTFFYAISSANATEVSGL